MGGKRKNGHELIGNHSQREYPSIFPQGYLEPGSGDGPAGKVKQVQTFWMKPMVCYSG